MRRLVILVVAVMLCGCLDKIDLNSTISKYMHDFYSKLNNYSRLNNTDLDNEIILNVGESAEYEGINVTVEKVWFCKDLKYFSSFYPLDRYQGVAPEGYQYMVIYVKIVNNGNRTLYTTAHDFIVVDNKNRIYSYNVLTHAFENALSLKELKRGDSNEGIIVFEVPENCSVYKIAYCFNSLADIRSFFKIFRSKWAIWVVER